VIWYCIKHYAGVIDIVWIYWLSIEPFRIEIIDCGCVRCISFNNRSPELTDRQLNISWCPFPYSFYPFLGPEVFKNTGSIQIMTGNEYIPDSARPRAISVPIPDVAPVTMATGAMLWTEKRVFLFFFWLCHDAQVVLGL